tara:strand:+ start:13612 stop:14340 length:729 start_codon:yes stop_codon:yes gene_type:complete
MVLFADEFLLQGIKKDDFSLANAMKVLVDTMNALHKTGVLPPDLAGMDVPGLVRALSRGRWSHNQVLLVCDGNPPPGDRIIRAGGIRTIYSGTSCEADDIIEQLIERSDAPTRLLVVSEDRRIIRSARRRRCHTMTSATFLRTIIHDHDRSAAKRSRSDSGTSPDRISRKAAHEWRDAFGINDEDIAEFKELAKPPPPPQPKQIPDTPSAPTPSAKTRRPRPGDELPEDVIREAMRMLEEDD